jgi:hypothetical protein
LEIVGNPVAIFSMEIIWVYYGFSDAIANARISFRNLSKL